MAHTEFDVKAPLMHDLVRLNGRWMPSKPAFIDHEKTHCWAEVDRFSNQIANGLRALGIERGDSVAIVMTSCVEYAEIIYGIWKAGGVVVPLNLAVTEEGLIGMKQDASVKVCFYSPDQFQRLEPYIDQVPSLHTHIMVNAPAVSSPEKVLSYSNWINAQSIDNPMVTIADTDACNIIYSSGTTGRPKGIKHVHRRRIQALYELALMHRYHFGAVSLVAIGLYSNIAWAPLLCSLLTGGTCIIQKEFNPAHWVDLVSTHKVTHTMMAPIMFQRILEADNFSSEAVASLQAVVSGGSPLFEKLKQDVTENFNCAVIELYGLTEGFLTSLQPEDTVGRITSVGKPVIGNDYILLDEDDRELAWDNVGEICVHSIHMMTEYHNRPDATDEVMYIDERGKHWLRTGDIGRIDAEGFLYITDRKKDMILSGGQNIFPADIESVIIQHPDVSEVAVIGVPDETWGETPIALIVPTAGGADAEAIKLWTNERVGKRQRIRDVYIRRDMPRNPNGKILKRELRTEFIEG